MSSSICHNQRECAQAAVVDQALRRVRSHPHSVRHADSVSIELDAGRLRLTGCVPTFYAKQLLQAVLAGLPGVDVIENQVRVVAGGAARPSSGALP